MKIFKSLRWFSSTNKIRVEDSKSLKMHEIYKLALENEAAKKYVDANRHLSDVINFLDESGLKQTEQYSKILKKMVSNYNNAGSYSES